MKKTNNYFLVKKEGNYFIPLCGTQEVGCNANIAQVNYNNKTEQIIVDAGLGMLKDFGGINHCIPDYYSLDPEYIKGIVITHGHLDHFGSLVYLLKHLRKRVPVYATKFTMHIIKRQLEDAHIETELITVEMNAAFSIGEFFDIQLINVTHSIPETQMVTITYKPSGIKLLHTADYKIDVDPVLGPQTNSEMLRKLGIDRINCLVSDSTNANHIDWTPTEKSAQEGLRQLITTIKNKRIIISCFSSNIARLSSLIQIANENNKKILFIGKSMHRMLDAARVTGYISPEMERNIITPEQEVDQQNLLVICTGSQGEPGSVLDKLAKCGSYNPITLNPNNPIKTAIVFSARIIPGRTAITDQVKSMLIHKGAEIYDTFEHKSIHVSGHPSQKEIKYVCDLVKPKYAIPVHGTQLLIQHSEKVFKNLNIPCIVPFNGCVFQLFEDNAKIIENVNVRQMGLDGKKLQPIDLNASVIQSRLHIGQEGVVSIVFKNKTILSINSIGCLPNHIVSSAMFNGIIRNVISANFDSTIIIKKIRSSISFRFGKNPAIILHNLGDRNIYEDSDEEQGEK